MIVFRETYDNRKKEIEEFIELMEFLERKENDRRMELASSVNFSIWEGKGYG